MTHFPVRNVVTGGKTLEEEERRRQGALTPQKYHVEMCLCSNRSPTRQHEAGTMGDLGSLQRNRVQGLEAQEESWARVWEGSKGALRGHISTSGWKRNSQMFGGGRRGGVENKTKQGLLQSVGLAIPNAAATWLLFLPLTTFHQTEAIWPLLPANKQVCSWTNYLEQMCPEKGQ